MTHAHAVSTDRRTRARWGVIVAILAISLATAVLGAFGARPHAEGELGDGVAARRMDLALTVRAGGVVASAVRTVVRCPVENVKGKKAATTVLELAPEGSTVKRGDVLCRLDASDYEELARRQVITVAQARADHQRAGLELDAATSALEEYRGGLHRLEEQAFEGRLATARAEENRSRDRLEWSRRMLARGYASKAQVADANETLDRARFARAQVEGEYRTYREHQSPRRMVELESRIASARADRMYQTVRLRREEERLSSLQRQVELCTIRAPHDGMLLFAHKPKRDVRIEEGMPVHQGQELFYLPDLSRMEIQVLLHETVVERVRPGMSARIRLEGSPGMRRGTVAVIDPLPVADRSKSSSGEVKNYMGRIPVDAGDLAMRPGATAEVVIETGRAAGVLVVPVAATRQDRGIKVCDVVGPGGIERRTVKVGRVCGDWQEVIGGISEGEVVALAGPSRR